MRPLLWTGPAAVAGAALADSGSRVAMLGALVAVAAAGVRFRRHAAVAICALVAGAAAHGGPETQTRPRAPPALASCVLDVIECGEDPFLRRGWCSGRLEGGAVLLCTWGGWVPPELLPGARIAISGRFFLARPAGNPGERGPRTPLRANLRTADNIEILEPAPPGLRASFFRVRRSLARRLVDGLPADVAPVAVALLLGIRSGIGDSDRVRYERTGTMHMLAISGLHVILLAGLIHTLLRRLGAGPRTAALVTLLLAWAYVPLTGAATPVRRAVTMLTTYGLALVRGRKPDPWSALSGAALLLVLHEPRDALRVGFFLSFAASGGILLLARPWHAQWGRRHRLLARFPAVRADHPIALRLRGYVLGAFPVSLAAWLATMAIAARAFGGVTPLAPFTNLLAIPFLAVLLPLLALFAGGLNLCAVPLTWAVRGLHGLLDAAASASGAYVFVAVVPIAALLMWSGGILLLRARVRPSLLLLAGAAGITLAGHPPRAVSVHLFDVGHGQAALIRFEDGAAVLVDAGSHTRPHLARRVLLPAMRRLGIRRFHTVICTHADADHWNALPALLARIPADRVLGSSPVAGAPVHTGQVIYATPRACLTVLAAGGLGSDNDRSAVLLLQVGETRVLLPADREERGLLDLLAQGVPPCEVLIAPHHGARCEVAAAVGRAVRPRWLLVSAARGFAHAETCAAYRGLSLQTWERGCLRIDFEPLRVQTFR